MMEKSPHSIPASSSTHKASNDASYQSSSSLEKHEIYPSPSNPFNSDQIFDEKQLELDPNFTSNSYSPHHSNSSIQSSIHTVSTNSKSKQSYKNFLLVFTLLSQSLGVIGFFASIYISLKAFIDPSHHSSYQTILAYLIIFIIATLFAIYISIDSLLNRNTYQLIALCFFQTAMTGLGLILPHQISDAIKDQISHHIFRMVEWRLIVVPGIFGLTTLTLIWLTWFFYKEFGWQIYKKLGADLQLKKALQIKSIFFMLQKFNFFFLVGFCVLIVQMRKENQNQLDILDIILPAIALGSSCLVILFATIAVELELVLFMAMYALVWAAAMVFLCYEAIIFHPLSKSLKNQRSFVLFSALSILLLFATGIMSLLCLRNFGKGLKQARTTWLFRSRRRESSIKGSATLQPCRAILD
ncbi:hypothetical protein O181_045309 [Austropuccinia psidii MF-1]|uniref:Uncharacterized protein n=1 Tax=Austropuccinia psidii MF-1 TaxID=1389203 RepID=A0A9Q3DLT6_9BASI|nr:hypothetical protein [Austropuccinia psidii MF-1]